MNNAAAKAIASISIGGATLGGLYFTHEPYCLLALFLIAALWRDDIL